MTKKPSEILEDALDLMTPEAWGKGSYYKDGKYCAVGFVMRAAGADLSQNISYEHLPHSEVEAAFIAENLLHKNTPEVEDHRGHYMPWFNDAASTSYEDVRLVMKHALEEALEEELAN